jgi:hypothetical protein
MTATTGWSGRIAAATVVLAIGGAGPAATSVQASEPWPATVEARYRLAFQGVEVGKLTFTSKTTGTTYTLSGNADVSVMLGLFKVNTFGTASGAITARAPAPRSYAFNWRGGKKKGAIRMGFDGDVAKDVAVEPPPGDDKDKVPLTVGHRTDVVDPMSAVMALTRAGGKPCERRAAVFDGKHRFDIVLSYKKETTIAGKRGSEKGIVCRVTYKPIAGHKPQSETAHFAANRDIEVVLRTLPGSEMTIPHAVYIPTDWGTASMVMDRVDVTSTAIGKIALTN